MAATFIRRLIKRWSSTMRDRLLTLLIVVLCVLPVSAQENLLFTSAASMSTSLSEADVSSSANDDWLAPGQWNLTLTGGASIGDDAAELYEAHFGIGCNLVQDLSLNFELIGGYATVDNRLGNTGHDGGLTGFDLIVRWHFLKGKKWAIYFDGGLGLMYSDHSVPANGTHFNFRDQMGLGVSFMIGESTRLITGARWHHISNLDKRGDDDNPGYDGAFVYAGVVIPF